MSNRQTTIRHILIINKLRRDKRGTFQDICDYLERESNLQGEDLTISKRTFTRDLSDIGDIYGIYTILSKKTFQMQLAIVVSKHSTFLMHFELKNVRKIIFFSTIDNVPEQSNFIPYLMLLTTINKSLLNIKFIFKRIN